MSADPVLLDLNRHLSRIEANEAFDDRVDAAIEAMSPIKAAVLLEQHFSDTGGDAILSKLAVAMVKGYTKESVRELDLAVDSAIRPYVEKELK